MMKRLGMTLHRLSQRKDASTAKPSAQSRRRLLAQVETLEGKALLSSMGPPKFSALVRPNTAPVVPDVNLRDTQLSAKQFQPQVAFVDSLAAVITTPTVTPEVVANIQTSMAACFNSKIPNAQLVTTLANDYKAAAYDGKFTALERVKLRADLTAVLISAGVKPIEMNRALAKAHFHYATPSTTPDEIRLTLRTFTIAAWSVYHAPRFS